MARRARAPKKIGILTDNEVSLAVDEIARLRNKMLSHLPPVPMTQQDVVDLFVPCDVQDTLSAAWGWTEGRGRCQFEVLNNIKIELDEWDNIKMLPPSSKIMSQERFIGSPLCETLLKAQEITGKFDTVRNVVNYFDSGGFDRGAVRYYWPTMMSLVPRLSASWPAQRCPKSTPPDFGSWLERIRETPATVALAQLMPVVDESQSFLRATLYTDFLGYFDFHPRFIS